MPGESANLYPVATDDEISQYYEQLSQNGTKSSILSILSPFLKNYIPKTLSKTYPTIITELYNPANLQFSSTISYIATESHEKQAHMLLVIANIHYWLRSIRISSIKIRKYSTCLYL